MNKIEDHLQTMSALSNGQNQDVTNYTQYLTYGVDVDNQVIRISLVKFNEPDRFQVGSPYLNIRNTKTETWGPDIELPNPHGLVFKAVTAFKGFDETSYILLLSEDGGEVFILYQETTNKNWRWYGKVTPKNSGVSSGFQWITSIRDNGGFPQIVLLGSDNKPYLLWQHAGNGDWYWGNLSNGGKTFKNVQLGMGNDGNLQAVLTGADGQPYLIWRDTQTWHWFGELPTDGGTNFKQVQSFSGNENNLQNVFLDQNNNLYLVWQSSGSGDWSWYGRLPLEQDQFNGTIAFYTTFPRNGGGSVFIGKQIKTNAFDVYEIAQDSSGNWAWKGFYKKIEF